MYSESLQTNIRRKRSMKAHNHASNSGGDFPILPWDRREAILNFILYGWVGDQTFYRKMSSAERRFYRVALDVIDAYGPFADARHEKFIRLKPL
jgi:hypothetical protein